MDTHEVIRQERPQSPQSRCALPPSERRAPALRVTGASLSRGAGAPRSRRYRVGVRASVSSSLELAAATYSLNKYPIIFQSLLKTPAPLPWACEKLAGSVNYLVVIGLSRPNKILTMNCFVTGASGFIGANLVHELLARGHHVKALLRPQSDVRGLKGANFERVHGDVADRVLLTGAIRGCDWCFHVAASYHLWLRDYAPMYATNVEGTRHVIEAAAAAGCARIVYTSTVGCIGLPKEVNGVVKHAEGNWTMRQALAALEEISGVPAPKVRIPYRVALAAAHVNEALAAVTGKPPKAPLAGVRMAKYKMWFNPDKAIRELGLPQTPPRP